MTNSASTIIIGTRKSLLAMTQTENVIEELKNKFPNYQFVIKKITTSGDDLKEWPQTDAKGLFVKEIEEALQSGEIDLAVHSMKDLPCETPQGLEIAAITKREKANDVLISRDGKKLDELPAASKIGTSSLRRKMQILEYNPELEVVEIRGNLDTRLKKLKDGECDALIVAAAGMIRLGWQDKITEIIRASIMLPAPGQGALGIEIKKDNEKVRALVNSLHDEDTAAEVTAERSFLEAMGGGCRTPLGALAGVITNTLNLKGGVESGTEAPMLKFCASGPKTKAKQLGQMLADIMREQKGDNHET
ncbi:MAG: hydroxymethylbilane synthase [Candidatus Omnitrophota bacterium]